MTYTTTAEASDVLADGKPVAWLSTTWGNIAVGDYVNDAADRVALVGEIRDPDADGLVYVRLLDPIVERRSGVTADGMPVTVRPHGLIRRMRVTT